MNGIYQIENSLCICNKIAEKLHKHAKIHLFSTYKKRNLFHFILCRFTFTIWPQCKCERNYRGSLLIAKESFIHIFKLCSILQPLILFALDWHSGICVGFKLTHNKKLQKHSFMNSVRIFTLTKGICSNAQNAK